MALPKEFVDFYINWSRKVDGYTQSNAQSHFDRFMTQYVIYNRLYCEATFQLSRQPDSGINLERLHFFPDAKAAQNYVADFLGSRYLITTLAQDSECSNAIGELIRILSNNEFFIKLHPVSGQRQIGKDEELLFKIRSGSSANKAKGILEFIYQVRCNMMHGQKDFSDRQIALLQPTNILLHKICGILYTKLDETDS